MRVGMRTGVSLQLVRGLAAAAVMAALPGFLASCASAGMTSGAAAATSSGNVIRLSNIDTLKSLFNRDDGHTRLILIFSPT
jgi:hypothetical protein